MSFDKFYPNRKDWRKPFKYHYIQRGCRPHGSCGYCYDSRFHSTRKRELSANEQLKYYLNNEWINDNDRLDIELDCGIWQSVEYTKPKITHYSSNCDWEHDGAFTNDEWDEIEKYITKKIF